jgi:hypothetical protein
MNVPHNIDSLHMLRGGKSVSAIGSLAVLYTDVLYKGMIMLIQAYR